MQDQWLTTTYITGYSEIDYASTINCNLMKKKLLKSSAYNIVLLKLLQLFKLLVLNTKLVFIL